MELNEIKMELHRIERNGVEEELNFCKVNCLIEN